VGGGRAAVDHFEGWCWRAAFCFVCRHSACVVYFESRVKSAGRQMECAPACLPAGRPPLSVCCWLRLSRLTGSLVIRSVVDPPQQHRHPPHSTHYSNTTTDQHNLIIIVLMRAPPAGPEKIILAWKIRGADVTPPEQRTARRIEYVLYSLSARPQQSRLL
jgi:hypothetical protein